MFTRQVVERSHPWFRGFHPVTEGCGRFTADEVRRLVPQDLRKIGCPESVMLRILESNAQLEKRKLTSIDAELRAKAERTRKLIEADKVVETEAARPAPYRPSVCWEQ